MARKSNNNKSQVLISVIVLIALAIAIAYFAINSIIASGIKSFGTKATATGVSVDSVSLYPFSGSIEIKGLVINNPDNYDIKNAITVGNLHVSVNISSLFSDTIVINKVIIDDFHLNYEPTVQGGSNLQDISHNISNYIASQKTTSAKTKTADEQKKPTKVVISHLAINNGTVIISSSVLKSNIQVILPRIVMDNIGSGQNQNAADVLQEILQEIMNAVTSASVDTKGINLNGLSQAKEGIGKTLGNTVKSIENSLGL